MAIAQQYNPVGLEGALFQTEKIVSDVDGFFGTSVGIDINVLFNLKDQFGNPATGVNVSVVYNGGSATITNYSALSLYAYRFPELTTIDISITGTGYTGKSLTIFIPEDGFRVVDTVLIKQSYQIVTKRIKYNKPPTLSVGPPTDGWLMNGTSGIHQKIRLKVPANIKCVEVWIQPHVLEGPYYQNWLLDMRDGTEGYVSGGAVNNAQVWINGISSNAYDQSSFVVDQWNRIVINVGQARSINPGTEFTILGRYTIPYEYFANVTIGRIRCYSRELNLSEISNPFMSIPYEKTLCSLEPAPSFNGTVIVDALGHQMNATITEGT